MKAVKRYLLNRWGIAHQEEELKRTQEALHRAQEESLRLKHRAESLERGFLESQSRGEELLRYIEGQETHRTNLLKENQRMASEIATLRREVRTMRERMAGLSQRMAHRTRRREGARAIAQPQSITHDEHLQQPKCL